MNMMSGSHVDYSGGAGAGDRFPQWSVQETRDFLMIRSELDLTFMETKRNKILWEVISTKMKERGYNRSADQCKCKWKNLVTRYKGFESMEQDGMRRQLQFPFYNELQAIFTGRMVWMEADQGGGSLKKKRSVMQLSSDDDDEDENNEEESDVQAIISKKRRMKMSSSSSSKDRVSVDVNNLKQILEELMKQQMQIEMQWMKVYESKEEERKMREMEWRQKMEELEKEKMMFDSRWRDREEERRIKEETRSEKRDALITLLLNKLAN